MAQIAESRSRSGAAGQSDLMTIYQRAYDQMSAGFPAERSKVCARCGAAISANYTTDYVKRWCVGCHA